MEGYWLKDSRVTPRPSQTGYAGCYLACPQPLKGSHPPLFYHLGDRRRTAIWEAQGPSACLRPAPSLFSSLHFPGAFSSSPRKNDRWEYLHRGSPPTQRGWPFQNTRKTISQLVSLSLRYVVWKITLEDTFTKTPNWLLPLGPHLWFPVSRKWGQVSSDFLDLAQSPSWDVVWQMLTS